MLFGGRDKNKIERIFTICEGPGDLKIPMSLVFSYFQMHLLQRKFL